MPGEDAPGSLAGYQILEVTIPAGSPAAGQALGSVTWPPGSIPVSVLRNRRLGEPEPGAPVIAGDRISLLTPLGQPPHRGDHLAVLSDHHRSDGLDPRTADVD